MEQRAEQSVVEFSFEGYAVRTVIGEDGEPWFVARDVCEILEHSNPTKAVMGLDDDELTLLKVRAGSDGQIREMNGISESGLYTLIIRSNKPNAKKFRKWVTAEVLPSIRKTGSYAMSGFKRGPDPEKLTPEKINEVGFATRAAANIVKGFGFWYDKKRARLMVNVLVKEATGIDVLQKLDYSGLVALGSTEEMEASVAGFVDQCCELAPQLSEVKKTFYLAYQKYCWRTKRITMNESSMARELHKMNDIGSSRPRIGGVRVHCFTGIGLLSGIIREHVRSGGSGREQEGTDWQGPTVVNRENPDGEVTI